MRVGALLKPTGKSALVKVAELARA